MISSPPGDKSLVTVYVEALQQPVVLGDDIRQPYHPPVRGPTVRCDVEGCPLYPRKRTCAVQLDVRYGPIADSCAAASRTPVRTMRRRRAPDAENPPRP